MSAANVLVAERIAECRKGCCEQNRKPCIYHEGMADGLDWAEDRIAALEKALKPFASEVRGVDLSTGADGWDGVIADCPLHLYSRCWNGNIGVTVGDCLHASELLGNHDFV